MLCFVNRASQYICVMKTSLITICPQFIPSISLCLTVDCLLAKPANRQLTERHNTYQLLYIYSIPSDDGLQIFPKHIEVD